MAAISPRKNVEWTGNAFRPYLSCNALSCSRSSSQPTLSALALDKRLSVGSAAATAGGVSDEGWVSSIFVHWPTADRSVRRMAHSRLRCRSDHRLWECLAVRGRTDRGGPRRDWPGHRCCRGTDTRSTRLG